MHPRAEQGKRPKRRARTRSRAQRAHESQCPADTGPPRQHRARRRPGRSFARDSADKNTKATTGRPGSPSPKPLVCDEPQRAHLGSRTEARERILPQTVTARDPALLRGGRARAPPKRVSKSLVRRPPFARLSEEAKGAWRLTVARFGRDGIDALRVSHASRLANALRIFGANAASSHRRCPLRMMWSFSPWVPTLRAGPPKGARLEEPSKPPRPLSVAVASKAPVSALSVTAPSAASRTWRNAKHSPSKPGPQWTSLV
jgi:hypothetical protein